MVCPRCGTAVSTTGECPVCAALPGETGVTLANTAPTFVEATRAAGPPPLITPPPEATAVTGATDATDGDDANLTLAAPGPAVTRVMSSSPAPAAVSRTAGPLSIGQSFGPRYHIIKALGVGGMGAVYHAWDAELGEAVAIKVIRREVMANPAAALDIEKRFKRELQLARQVTHKNVVRIHDLGDIDGIKYITMSYVDGTDLATFLKREGTVPVERALKIVRGVVDGLIAAHAAGVVHRDLKPANIMIRKDGEALIMDFGIARSTSGGPDLASVPIASLPEDLRAQATRSVAPTAAGAVVGTVQYMAPEQARAQDVDQRADLYALGLIFYDMLAGRVRSQHAESAIAELRGRMEKAPPSILGVAPAVPKALGQIIDRCLAPDPDDRFASTQALADALSRLNERGELRPIKRVVSLPVMVGVIVLLLAASVANYYYQRQFIPPPVHDPVSIVIADVQNRTNDPTFDRTLEPMLKRALEDAGFITAYERNNLRGLGVTPREQLDDNGAHEVALQAGLGYVLSGAIEPQGGGYRVSLRARQTVTGAEVANEQARAASKDQVLNVATQLVSGVRSALGDSTSESAQQFAMASITATSLDVVRLYAQAMEAQSGNRFEDALKLAQQAVSLDPKFGVGYLISAIVSRNMGRLEDNQKFLDEALAHLDGMTERERFQTRGYAYWSTGDYEGCVKEFGELITRYPGDVAGRNQLALCLSNQREMRRAMVEVRQIVKLLPSHPLFRDNLALYANYASDFVTAEQEARAVKGQDAYATLAIAMAQTGQGQFAQARDTYRALAQLGPVGASIASSGLGDLAAVEGRYAEAVQTLRQGVDADVAAKNTDSAAAKVAAIAFAELSRGRTTPAIDAADEALRYSQAVKIRFLAARTFIEAGADERARPLIEGLGKELYAEPRAYAKLLDGLVALSAGDARQAMTLLRDGNDQFDTWIGYFDLGRASLAAQAFTQADSAFDVCLNSRRGEALSLFVDEEPTYAYFPQAYFYQGLVREGLKSAGAADAFKQYLAIRGAGTDDPLARQARERMRP